MGPDFRQSASSQLSDVQLDCSTVSTKRLLCAATLKAPEADRSTTAAAIGRASSNAVSSAVARCGFALVFCDRRRAKGPDERVIAACIRRLCAQIG